MQSNFFRESGFSSHLYELRSLYITKIGSEDFICVADKEYNLLWDLIFIYLKYILTAVTFKECIISLTLEFEWWTRFKLAFIFKSFKLDKIFNIYSDYYLDNRIELHLIFYLYLLIYWKICKLILCLCWNFALKILNSYL